MKHKWLYLSKTDVETERLQCEQEGKDLSSVDEEFARVLALDLDDEANQPAAEVLLDRTIALPNVADYRYVEPSTLPEILASRPAQPKLGGLSLTDAELLDRLHGAWAGRSVGCLLGKAIEGWKRPAAWGYLKELGRWPLDDFYRYDIATDEMRRKYEMKPDGVFVDRVDSMPEDDDLNYTTAGLAILKQYGPGFTPDDVATFWQQNIPLLNTCTAERISHRNFANGLKPPACATFRNPYREWIGAQIRADIYGYVAPGNPALAAEMAWRDASISHVKNGIYGAMWVAGMTAAAFVSDDIHTIIRAGLGQIPAKSRLTSAVEDILEWEEVGCDYDTAVYRIHEMWDENRWHDWTHTLSNAMIVASALIWGDKEYGTSICRAVQPCFDTDCNGATVGSLLGILHGRKALPEKWTGPINDTLNTGVAGYERVKLADMARETLGVVGKVVG